MFKCPKCGEIDVGITEARDTPVNRVRRRRVCRKCGYRFTTYEVYIPDGDDPREHWKEFMRGKGGNKKAWKNKKSCTVLS